MCTEVDMDYGTHDGVGWQDRLEREGREGLAAAIEHYRARLKRMVLIRMDPRLSGRVDPSDVVQEAYLDAARQLRYYLDDPQVSVFIWLRRLAWERLLNLRRHHLGTKKRDLARELHLPEASSMALGRMLLARGPSPSQRALAAEVRDQVQKAISLLPGRDREVILLRHFEELSNRETAEVLGIRESAATMRYGRALLRLREALDTGKNGRDTDGEPGPW